MSLKKLFSALMVCSLMLTVLSISASANTVDRTYYYEGVSAGSWYLTSREWKDTSSEVYVAPTTGPNGYTKVQTWCFVYGAPKNKTTYGTVELISGKKYAIDNFVHEDGDKESGSVKMWLSLSPKRGSGYLSGCWSPDYTPEKGVEKV